MAKLQPPENLDFSNPNKWNDWKQRFNFFRTASKLHKEDGDIQVATLIYTMGKDADHLLQSFDLSATDSKDFNKVLEKFDKYFIPKKNIIHERAKFHSRKQNSGETVESFIRALHELAEHCHFQSADVKNEQIRDKIVIGILDTNLSEKMQLESDLTLEKAKTMARQSEVVKSQVKTQHKGDPSSADEIRRGARAKQPSGAKPTGSTGGFQPKTTGSTGGFQPKPTGFTGGFQPKPTGSSHKDPKRGQYFKMQQNEQYKRCLSCNKYHAKGNCPAYGKICRKCDRYNHFAACCKTKRVSELCVEEQSSYLGAINSAAKEPWTIDLKVRHLLVHFKLDTGADVTVVPVSLYESLGRPKLTKTDKPLQGPGNKTLSVKGFFTENLSHNGRSAPEDIYVVQGIDRCLLGRPALKNLNLVKLNIDEIISLESVKQKHPNLFRELGQLDGEYRITLNENAQPHALSVPRRVPIPLLPKVKAELEKMESSGVIFKVDECTDWCAGMVCIPKPDNSVRICVDLTHLNKSVRRENFPLPIIEQSLGRMAGAKYFSKLDANSSFWQIKLAEESKLLTTFITPFGRYAFHRLVMGLSSASEYFQKRMSQILEGIDGVLCQTDDVLVFGRTEDEHDSRLETVLAKLEAANLTLNPDKCVFKQKQVKFVGHLVGQDGVAADPDKVKAIRNLSPPKDIHGVRSFMGMVNQLGKFSPSLANDSKPIRDLLSNKNQFYWGSSQQKAFEKIKVALTNTPVLALYDPNRETMLMTDSSKYATGSVVLQKQDNGEFKPIAYASRAFTPTEVRYSVIEKEALGVVTGAERHSDLLIGKHFQIQTDHKSLVSLLGQKDLSDLPIRVQRFRMRLLRFSYSISFLPGKLMYIPDLLSRTVCDELTAQDQFDCESTEMYVDSVVKSLPATDQRLEEIKTKQKSDYVCGKLIEYVHNGWPSPNTCEIAKLYGPFKAQITINKGLLMRNDRLIIPSDMRPDILTRLHQAHQGISKCRLRAKESVWWIGISRDIEAMIKNCDICAKMQNDKREPMISTPFPERCWAKLGADLFHWKGSNYLLVIDYFSRYIEISRLTSTSSCVFVF